MKHTLITVGLLIVIVGTTFAQSNVEKAKRFRVQKAASTVETQASSHLEQVATQDVTANVLQNNASTQLHELGPRWRWWNAEQLDELGPRWRWWNAEQLDELGPRWRWWNAAQLDGEK